jgi:hypothetical protein
MYGLALCLPNVGQPQGLPVPHKIRKTLKIRGSSGLIFLSTDQEIGWPSTQRVNTYDRTIHCINNRVECSLRRSASRRTQSVPDGIPPQE